MSVEDCERALRATAAALQPVLEPLGFRFQVHQAGEAHQGFASWFFVRDGIRIGLIYRESDRFGSVLYENAATNVSHDDLMSWLGLAAEQRLRYVGSSMKSVAVDGGNAIDALRADLVTLEPTLRDPQTLSRAIDDARRESERATREATAIQSAKLEAWLQRRREKQG